MTSHQLRYLTMAREATYNDSSTEVNVYVGEVESESYQQSYDVLKRNDINYYGARKAIVSKKIAEGSFTCALQPDSFVLCALHGIMGVDTPSTDSGSTPTTDERRFTEIPLTASTELPSYTIRVGRDDYEHIFPGQVIESIAVSASIGEYAMLTVNTVGAEQEDAEGTLETTYVPDYTGDAAHFAGAYVNFESVATNSAFSNMVQSIDFEIKTNRDMDNAYSLGSETCVRAPPITLREVSGSITFHKALDSTDSASGAPYFEELRAATAAGGEALFDPSGADVPALSALFRVDADNYIRFDFGRVIYEMPETSVSGRDSQTMTVNFHALWEDDASGRDGMVEITAKGTGASDYDAV